jgi:branched-chain amino acid aminotransferase
VKPFVAEGSVWLDGRIADAREATVELIDPAVQAGLGVFETLAVRQGRPIDLDEHLERLAQSASGLTVPLPDRATLAAAAIERAAQVAGGYGWLKVSAVRGGRCVIWAGRLDPAEEGRTVTAIVLPWRRSPHEATAGLKTLNYAGAVLGAEEARRRGADEGLWLNTRGHLTEGSTSNLFVVRRRALYTASESDGILAGITRGHVLRAGRELKLMIHEGKLRWKRLATADEAFLCSSVRGLRPLVAVDGQPVGRGGPGPITLALARRVEELRGIKRAGAVERAGP